jgi:hypothetical protein
MLHPIPVNSHWSIPFATKRGSCWQKDCIDLGYEWKNATQNSDSMPRTGLYLLYLSWNPQTGLTPCTMALIREGLTCNLNAKTTHGYVYTFYVSWSCPKCWFSTCVWRWYSKNTVVFKTASVISTMQLTSKALGLMFRNRSWANACAKIYSPENCCRLFSIKVARKKIFHLYYNLQCAELNRVANPLPRQKWTIQRYNQLNWYWVYCYLQYWSCNQNNWTRQALILQQVELIRFQNRHSCWHNILGR